MSLLLLLGVGLVQCALLVRFPFLHVRVAVRGFWRWTLDVCGHYLQGVHPSVRLVSLAFEVLKLHGRAVVVNRLACPDSATLRLLAWGVFGVLASHA